MKKKNSVRKGDPVPQRTRPGEAAGPTWHRWFLFAAILVATFRLAPPAFAEDSVCARVRIEILQELTLERQAFEARMTINNGLAGVPLMDINVDVTFADKNGNPVRATSNPNDLTALFYIRYQTGSGLPASIGGGSSAQITWLIIPAKGAAGPDPQGTLYLVGATLSYQTAGDTQEVAVSPDSIWVKPMPDLTLDYFLPDEVYGDDPFTSTVEELPVPFSLGVRVQNTGFGTAMKLKIDSAQPTIVENELGLLVDFRIEGCEVNGQLVTSSLLADFGDIPPNRSGVARWIMISTLSGRFVEFTAHYTHADELGGELTSLLTGQPRTHFLVHDVLVNLPGRDTIRDFLAKDGDTLRVYESENADSTVIDLSSRSGISGAEGRYTVTTIPSAGFSFIKLADPYSGQKRLKSSSRADGKPLPPANAWLSQTWDHNAMSWQYFVNIFDVNNTAGHSYGLEYEVPPSPTNRPPRLDAMSDWTLSAGNFLSFLVTATDPDGNHLSYALGAAPAGASLNPVTGLFTWRPTQEQSPTTNVIAVQVTDDGSPPLSDLRTFNVVVARNTAPKLATVEAQSANVLSMLRFTNSAEDVDWPVNNLMYFLEPGTPEGAWINQTNGVFSWTPTRNEGPSTNFITVTVMDNGVPPLSDSKTFTVIVNHYMELSVGSTLMPVGATSSVPITVFSSAPLTNVALALDFPPSRLTDWWLVPNDGFEGGVLATNETNAVVGCAPLPGDWLQSTQLVGALYFVSVSNQPSAFVPLNITGFLGIRVDGTEIPWTLLNNGRATVIGNEALLVAGAPMETNQPRSMQLYGKAGTSYQVEYTSDLGSEPWTGGLRVVLTNFSTSVILPSASNAVIFFRARQEPQ